MFTFVYPEIHLSKRKPYRPKGSLWVFLLRNASSDICFPTFYNDHKLVIWNVIIRHGKNMVATSKSPQVSYWKF